MRSLLRALVVVVLSLLSSSCSKSTEFFLLTSPDGQWRISALSHTWSLDGLLRIELTGPRGTKSIHKGRGDFLACFADAHWTADSRTVAVVVRNCFAGIELVAFDTRTQSLVDVEAFKDPLRLAIVQHHGPLHPPNMDPLAWVLSDDAEDRFRNHR
jgi:hypothetical protein